MKRGDGIKATLAHDGGAYGRCSFCGRYSDNSRILLKKNLCDCGKKAGWSGSFKKPGKNAIWSDAA